MRLPEKLTRALDKVLSRELPGVILRTTWKPTATIPILWFVATEKRCVLISTLRGGQTYREIRYSEINSLRSEAGRIILLPADPDAEDWSVPIDAGYKDRIIEFVGYVTARLTN